MDIVYFKKEIINLEEVLSKAGVFEFENGLYNYKSETGQYICINPEDRSIMEYGYDELVMSWIDAGFIEGYESKAEREQKVIEFPHTIGKITFKSRQHLEEYVLEHQRADEIQ